MPRFIHPLAGLLAILTIATFWLSTALSELFASEATVVAVKTAIPWGFLLLAPALAATSGSGFALSNGQRQGSVGTKLKRMPFIAANGPPASACKRTNRASSSGVSPWRFWFSATWA